MVFSRMMFENLSRARELNENDALFALILILTKNLNLYSTIKTI